MPYRLTNWSVCHTPNPYLAPECHTQHLQGNVEGHPNFATGESILSSRIIGRAGDLVVTESGSRYILLAEEVNPAYEALFPSALTRLLSSLPEILS